MLIYITAGEQYSDEIGEKIITKFRAKSTNVKLIGIGGTKMLKSGLQYSVFI